MHRALLQPEIVEAIVRNTYPGTGFHFTCLRLNKLFFQETVRVLWQRCGKGEDDKKHRPSIQDLAELEDARRRFYAQNVRVLALGEVMVDGHYAKTIEDIVYIPQLQDLAWPRLMEVAFFKHCKGEDMLPLLRANLARLTVYAGTRMRKVVLESLREHSSRLRSLELRIFDRNKITVQALQKFLSHCTGLEGLKILEMEWTSESFETVARYQHLHTLACPPILPGWASKLYSGFPALTSLTCAVSAEVLEELSHLAPRLTYLQINIEAPQHGLVGAASKFANLEALVLMITQEWVDWDIYGAELVSLARNCPNLQKFRVTNICKERYIVGHWPESNYRRKPNRENYVGPWGQDLSDENMAAAAFHFRNLKSLEMKIRSIYGVSMPSVIALCENCRALEHLKITCEWDWAFFKETNLQTSFPAMKCLLVRMPPRIIGDPPAWDADSSFWLEKLAELLPNLERFDMKGKTHFDWRVITAIEGAIRKGTWGKPRISSSE